MTSRLISISYGLLVAALVFGAWFWMFWVIHVPPRSMLVVTRSFGASNPDANRYRVVPYGELELDDGRRISGVQGVLEEVYGEGYYAFNPFLYKTEVLRDALTEVRVGQVGVLTSLSGLQLPEGQFLVDQPGRFKGTLRQVLPPGRYRINPYAYRIEILPATIVEQGYVGVVTSQTGRSESGDGDRLAESGEMGVMREVLQPGLYYLNPREYKVTRVEVGFREHSISGIRFPSRDGYPIECDVTVIWGIHPENAPYIVKNIGASDDEIKQRVIDQVVQSATRNMGGEYDAATLVSGEGRTLFVEQFTEQLRKECQVGNRIDILNGLIRRIIVPQEIRKPIQEQQIQREREETLKQQNATQVLRNDLQRVQSDVELIVKVTEAETTKIIAQRREEGLKKAATIRAEAEARIAAVLKPTPSGCWARRAPSNRSCSKKLRPTASRRSLRHSARLKPTRGMCLLRSCPNVSAFCCGMPAPGRSGRICHRS
jgi:regulator of protease activity HflC (stomatin/prohibitin superfamily)